MLRTPLAVAGVLALGASTFAQSPQQPKPIAGQKDAGVLHLATNTWTHNGASALAWDDVLFDNTCSTGYFGPHDSVHRMVDDGRIPSTSSPNNPGPPVSAVSWAGTQDAYQINMFEIGYCTYEQLPTIEINFWECFEGCQDSTVLTPLQTFTLNNMPGSAGSGAVACWTVGIDLANTGSAFMMNADCDGQWDNSDVLDHFGWSWQHITPSIAGTPGPFIAGDPKGYLNGGPGSSGCDYGANTVFYGGATPATQGTGLSGEDHWEYDLMTPTPVPQYCYYYGGYFNGYLYASFHMIVSGDASAPTPEPGFQYCPGDGVSPHTPCPCGNDNDGSMSGCDWVTAGGGAGAALTATGDPNYVNPDVTLVATNVENNFGIFFGANNQTNGGNGALFGDGLRCAGGGLVRLTAPTLASGNTASHGPVEASDISAGPGVTRRYQYWFRTPGGPCGTIFNLSNGYEIAWL